VFCCPTLLYVRFVLFSGDYRSHDTMKFLDDWFMVKDVGVCCCLFLLFVWIGVGECLCFVVCLLIVGLFVCLLACYAWLCVWFDRRVVRWTCACVCLIETFFR